MRKLVCLEAFPGWKLCPAAHQGRPLRTASVSNLSPSVASLAAVRGGTRRCAALLVLPSAPDRGCVMPIPVVNNFLYAVRTERALRVGGGPPNGFWRPKPALSGRPPLSHPARLRLGCAAARRRSLAAFGPRLEKAAAFGFPHAQAFCCGRRWWY